MPCRSHADIQQPIEALLGINPPRGSTLFAAGRFLTPPGSIPSTGTPPPTSRSVRGATLAPRYEEIKFTVE